MEENLDAWELALACQTQLRTSFGGLVGLDYNAVFHVADVLGIEVTPGTLRKLRALERELLKRGNDGDP